ncbi:MAG: MBL fold metallo-hydrolase [Phycisphaerales bacterium]
MDIRVISIGTLAANPLWNEKAGSSVRSGHATTTLIRSGKRTILIDPGLPGPALAARLSERAGIHPGEVSHVFLTAFKPDVFRGILAFEHATWWVSEAEREQVGVPLIQQLRQAAEAGDDELKEALETDVAILKRCQPAPDRLAERVDLFPLPGVTPGTCGVLVSGPASGIGNGTALVCGDAVPTLEHLERAGVLHGAADVKQAQDSLKEAVEIADVLILGRDNWVVNPLRRGF